MKSGRYAVLWLLIMVLGGCQSRDRDRYVDNGEYWQAQPAIAQSHSPRVRFLVLHYTAEDFDRALDTLSAGNVSAHYLVPAAPPYREGKPVLWQLLPETLAAWHAGSSYWRGVRQLNTSSIGIEQENPGWRHTAAGTRYWQPYTSEQIALVIALARQIIQRYHIDAQNVVGHSDVAPQRKIDPGPHFPWQQLAQAGVGAWPDAERVRFYLRHRYEYAPVERAALLEKLARYGYEVRPDMSDIQQRRVVAAFQMHFRPQRYEGEADAQTEAIAEALLEKYPSAP
ncbi:MULTISPECIES: N-acetylmuramoyl-L-alanine amidase [Dickeya]|uniref:N-acetylmuramoyl-L-alanine amidase n=1 Tax=Dickeya aquatica TaxID=1401087 RepID=A0A375AA50_9GAMM|nr:MULTISPECIES: N-acetylmuramoyl-L-alanine amidase [Dickeya]SLM62968.1 1,6-anhydro-N-acetylmuramyl-L-alanine amidase. AmiD also cleaves N-acetylmuramyl-L-alanine bonds in murein and muropeptides (Uehara, 2007) [Dickeya aquatica]